MCSLRRILLVLDETIHLRGHVCHCFGRNLADNEVRIIVIAHNLSIVVVGGILAAPITGRAQHIWRELGVITHYQHINQIVVSIIIVVGYKSLDCGAGGADRFQCDQLGFISCFRLPFHIRLHSGTELLRGNNKHVAIFWQRSRAEGFVVQKMVRIDSIKRFGYSTQTWHRRTAVQMDFHRQTLVHLQGLLHRIVGKRKTLDGHTTIITQMIGVS